MRGDASHAGLGKCPRERPPATWALDPPAFGRADGFVQKPRPVVPAQPPSRICHGKFSRRHDYCLGWVRRVSSCFRIGNQLFAKTLGAGKSGTGWPPLTGSSCGEKGKGGRPPPARGPVVIAKTHKGSTYALHTFHLRPATGTGGCGGGRRGGRPIQWGRNGAGAHLVSRAPPPSHAARTY